VSSPETLDRKVLAAAFLRAQALLNAQQPVAPEEAQRIEETLRPLAAAQEIRQIIVPLLDRAKLSGLAMAWDSGADTKSEAWLVTRAARFVALTAPEFAFITLCELNRDSPAVEQAKQNALAALEQERALRTPMFEHNVAAVAEVDPVQARELRKTHRTTVALRPLGAGLAEFAGPGQPWVQLWAVTADAARTEAERLVRQCGKFDDGFIAGVGDCSLPDAAARIARPEQRMHVIDLQLARVRALLEVVDMSEAVRARRIQLHAGPRALQTLAPFAARALAHEQSVVGGDPVAFSLLRAAAQGQS
jgi:hypothetical protein